MIYDELERKRSVSANRACRYQFAQVSRVKRDRDGREKGDLRQIDTVKFIDYMENAWLTTLCFRVCDGIISVFKYLIVDHILVIALRPGVQRGHDLFVLE